MAERERTMPDGTSREAPFHPALRPPTGEELVALLHDARARTLARLADLRDDQLAVPQLDIVNPLLWELGHVGWFQEQWLLRWRSDGTRAASLLRTADACFDSAAVAHDTRFGLRLPSRRVVHDYLRRVLDATCTRLLRAPPDAVTTYFAQLALFHEDMHGEAFAYMRQTLALPEPPAAVAPAAPAAPTEVAHTDAPLAGDVEIPGGTFVRGAEPRRTFLFDNEKWAHPVQVASFRLARALVTQGEFARFVDAGGYARRDFWDAAGWEWRTQSGAEHPLDWRREPDGSWSRRRFDRWLPLEPTRPVVHVNWFEARAYCCANGRRLPTEAEWELAASGTFGPGRTLAPARRTFPWGEAPPTARHARLGGDALDTLEVAALPAGDSAFGVRQLLGNVWEWTASAFDPYPGFSADPYREYSQPWFGTRKVLRGGSFATPARQIWNTLRNFYTPERRDPFAGFRTAAL